MAPGDASTVATCAPATWARRLDKSQSAVTQPPLAVSERVAVVCWMSPWMTRGRATSTGFRTSTGRLVSSDPECRRDAAVLGDLTRNDSNAGGIRAAEMQEGQAETDAARGVGGAPRSPGCVRLTAPRKVKAPAHQPFSSTEVTEYATVTSRSVVPRKPDDDRDRANRVAQLEPIRLDLVRLVVGGVHFAEPFCVGAKQPLAVAEGSTENATSPRPPCSPGPGPRWPGTATASAPMAAGWLHAAPGCRVGQRRPCSAVSSGPTTPPPLPASDPSRRLPPPGARTLRAGRAGSSSSTSNNKQVPSTCRPSARSIATLMITISPCSKGTSASRHSSPNPPAEGFTV